MTFWLPIKGYKNYEVSEDGRIRSIDRVVKSANGQKRHYAGRELSQSMSAGYASVFLSENDKGRTMYVHTAVAEAFNRKPYGSSGHRLVVKHIDGDRTNNHASNLEWSVWKPSRVERVPRTGFSVYVVNTGKTYPSIRAAARATGVSAQQIKDVIEHGGTANGIAFMKGDNND